LKALLTEGPPDVGYSLRGSMMLLAVRDSAPAGERKPASRNR
jgi:hypothetical protein